MAFWDSPQPGANSFNRVPPDLAYFDALADTGATWVRLTFSKWDGAGRDFLLGDADAYAGIPQDDLALLEQVLDAADAAGLGVVLVPLSLPGARWQQQNGGRFDDRLWSDRDYWTQAARFWRDVAAALAGHPAITAYNIVNEPAPERTQGLPENAPVDESIAFMRKASGTARDLPGFYAQVIAAIREVDTVTPVMVDGGYHANPRHLAAWPQPLSDARVLYAFHMYEPWAATSAANLRRDTPLGYPGAESLYAGEITAWDAAVVRQHVAMAFDWAAKNELPVTRMVAAEFGCMRQWADCGTYLEDVLDAVESFGAHWAFYAFREDEWEGMDYEIPPGFKAGRYYWLRENGQADRVPRNGELMQLLKGRIRAANADAR